MLRLIYRSVVSTDPAMRGRSAGLCLLLPLTIFSLFIGRVSGFKICSYNVQNFTLSKASDLRMLHTFTRVVSRCDICLLLHVVDPDGKAIKALLSNLSRKLFRYNRDRYLSVASKGLGNSPGDMQQYVFIYRAHSVKVTGQYQYTGQPFVRPPFVVRFSSNKTAIPEFILIPLHSDPDQAVQEIDGLYDVFVEVSTQWNNTNVMFLGDFHAGCAYVTRSDRKDIRLYSDSSFSWLIGDREDTTVNDITNCAFDRIVVHGQTFLKAIQPFSGKVFNFGREFKLPQRKVLEMSDHFPIEVTLKSPALLLQATPPLIFLCISVIVQCFL
uniref:Deoxyribonuclease-1-like 1 n=1 Tax=Nothobranchius furzeri TaxID=105023 RepID=A0A8C6PYB7_NOTFU